jgi:hypothetical protein
VNAEITLPAKHSKCHLIGPIGDQLSQLGLVACVKFSNLAMVVWVVSVENLLCQSRP